MMKTKKELIKEYNEGISKDYGYYNPSAFDVFIIIGFNDEQIFGYYQYEQNEKEFFLVRINHLENDFSFRVRGVTLRGSECMRIWR